MPHPQENSLPGDLDWAPQDVPLSVKALEDKCLAWTNWPALIAAASRAKGQPCTLPPSYRTGGTSLARLLQFEDRTHWVARVQLHGTTPEYSQRLRVEVDTMALLRAAEASAPRVFAFDGDGDEVGSAFILMKFSRGNIALDEAEKYERPRWGLIPLEHQSACYRSIALAHVSIPLFLPFALRQQTYSSPLVPLLGNPWQVRIESPASQTAPLPPVRSQASEVRSPQHRLSSRHYADEEAYARMLRDAENDAGADDGLSGMLGDGDARDLAGVVHSYLAGKVGLYDRAKDYFENKYK